jgi:hypothetical protein
MPAHVCTISYGKKAPTFVISNAVRNLVLGRDVPPFPSLLVLYTEKRAVWVVRDEISHCVRNDKGGLGSTIEACLEVGRPV